MPRGRESSFAILTGGRSGCPFCIARVRTCPDLGTRIMLLNNFREGMIGTVSKVDLDARFPRSAFLMIVDDAPPGEEQIVNLEYDLIAPVEPREPLPAWLPPLRLREAAELDELVVSFCDRFSASGRFAWDRSLFYGVIRGCWERRFPLTPNELYAVLHAHGLPAEFEEESKRAFEEGRDLLVYTIGRRPIKKKRVEPLLGF